MKSRWLDRTGILFDLELAPSENLFRIFCFALFLFYSTLFDFDVSNDNIVLLHKKFTRRIFFFSIYIYIYTYTYTYTYTCQRPISELGQSEIRLGQCWIINSFIIKSSYFYDLSWKINGSLIKNVCTMVLECSKSSYSLLQLYRKN